jgi:hypothetical protein
MEFTIVGYEQQRYHSLNFRAEVAKLYSFFFYSMIESPCCPHLGSGISRTKIRFNIPCLE